MEKEFVSKATLLSMKRKGSAKDLENAMKQELQMLEMGGTQFEVKFHSMGAGEGNAAKQIMNEIKADGYDRVEFMLSPNVGEDLRPLSRIASGGELSRIMLAMKTILARTASVETIIFDEVDAGISGATAEVVGEKLQSLAAYHQTLCITHLPQIASKGNTHFLVKKEVIAGRTQTVISKMDSEERVKEIARLLGGRIISQKAVAHAREMLG
jgi:DNA repair protein RecN (Recombination protein N)